MQDTACCFFGHRTISNTNELTEKLYSTIEELIVNKKVDTFFFGSKSQFNTLCHELVTKIREKYPHIRRIYVRAEFPQIDDDYKEYLLESYEDTYYPIKLLRAGRAVYVERNREMIDKSRFCVVYCQDEYSPKNRKSGTHLALNYAIMRDREVIIFP